MGGTCLTVGSDQTDRGEAVELPRSKQICRRVVAKQVWRYGEVKDHYDEPVLRSEVEKDGQKYLCPKGPVSTV